MLKLQTVNKLSTAQEIRDQTLKEAQEVSTALIAAEQRIGELLLAIPTAQGKRTDIETSVERPTKVQTIKEMGYGTTEAKDYQAMAKNPEVVQKVIEDALANGDVVTKSQVMKEIKALKDQMEYRDRKIRDLESREPETRIIEKTVEVVPEDYETLKRDLESARRDARRAESDFEKMRTKADEARRKLEQFEAKIGADEKLKDASRDINYFTNATFDYIRRYGGHVWAFTEIEHIDDETRNEFIKAIKTLDGFAQQLIRNLNGGNLQ